MIYSCDMRIKFLMICLLVASFVAGQVPIAYAGEFREGAQAQSERPSFVPGEVIVKYKDMPQSGGMGILRAQDPVQKLEQKTGRAVEAVSRAQGIALVKYDEGADVEALARSLAADSDIEYAQPNYMYYPQALDIDDTRAIELWGLEKISMESAWALSEATSTSEVIVAVIDTGVAFGHPDLAANMWDGTNCVSDTGAALGGCQHGYDFAGNDTDPRPLIDSPNTNEGMHGSHVAGTIAAVRNNNVGIAGVAPRAKIMALRSRLATTEIVKAINFAKENGAKVINASFGGDSSDTALQNAIAAFPGLFIAAAGNTTNNNDSSAFYPCNYTLDNILCVASTNSSDGISSFSNYGATSVDLAAPGSSILSLDPTVAVVDEDLSGITVPATPTGWTHSGTTNNWRTATTSIGADVYTHLYADTSSPYADNADSSLTMPAVDLAANDTFRAQLAFGLRCETETATSTWEDYLAVEFSSDGTNFSAASTTVYTGSGSRFTMSETRFDAEVVQQLGGTASGQPGYGVSLYLDIPAEFRSSATRIRYRWVTNATDSNYIGCRLSAIEVTRFDNGDNYSTESGTSMATPHVAGLAALVQGYVPSIDASSTKAAIMQTVDTLSALSGNTVTGGRINTHAALKRAKSIEKEILTFDFAEASSTVTIDHASSTITATLPYGTNLASLTPLTTQSGDASVSSTGTQDFSTTTTLIVTSLLDNSTTSYSVTAAVATLASMTISLVGDASVTFVAGTSWTDPGATTTNASGTVVMVLDPASIDTNTAQTIVRTYTATDAEGQVASTTRTITITAPVFSGGGSSGGGGGGGGSSGGGGGGGSSSSSATTPVVTPVETVALTTVPTPALQPLTTRFTFTQNLDLGAAGNEVTELQKRLVAEGLLVMPAGVAFGYFGQATKNAVVAFQQKHTISPAAGFVGALTRAKLNTPTGIVAGTSTVVTATAQTPILTDTARQALILQLQTMLVSLVKQLAELMAAQQR